MTFDEWFKTQNFPAEARGVALAAWSANDMQWRTTMREGMPYAMPSLATACGIALDKWAAIYGMSRDYFVDGLETDHNLRKRLYDRARDETCRHVWTVAADGMHTVCTHCGRVPDARS